MSRCSLPCLLALLAAVGSGCQREQPYGEVKGVVTLDGKPLAHAEVIIEDSDDLPGMYHAKFFLRPHYQLEGITALVRLVSRLSPSKQ